jgi:hypothetical protein
VSAHKRGVRPASQISARRASRRWRLFNDRVGLDAVSTNRPNLIPSSKLRSTQWSESVSGLDRWHAMYEPSNLGPSITLARLQGAAVMPVAQGAVDCHLMTLTYTGDMTPWIVEILTDSSVQTAASKRVEA